MSQTLQSIHSLSVQLNRAASMQDHLNDICHSPLQHHASLGAAAAMGQSSKRLQVTGRLSQLVGKKARRAKELLLQNIGKASGTRDTVFQVYEKNFYRQQEHASKLHKEFKGYLEALEACQAAGRSLSRCIQQSTGDYQSARHDLVCENLSQLEHLNEDLLDKLRGQVLVGLGEYLAQFNEMRQRIAKRRRKLVDYDSSRRHYERSLAALNRRRQQQDLEQAGPLPGQQQQQSATSQLVEEARLLKLREQFNYCKVMYEAINGELQEQLPQVYEKKMKNLLRSLQGYFSLEAQFHSNVVKLYATAADVIDELPMSLQMRTAVHSSATAVHLHGSSSKLAPEEADDDDEEEDQNHEEEEEEEEDQVGAEAHEQPSDTGCAYAEYAAAVGVAGSSSSGMGSSRGADSSPGSASPACSPGNCSPVDSEAPPADEDADQVEEPPASESPEVAVVGPALVQEEPVVEVAEKKEAPQDDVLLCESEQVPVSEASKEEPEVVAEPIARVEQASTQALCATPGFLYKVKTIFKYLAEDVDELCFEADEIIQVVEQEESQEPEEGWLVGVREVNGQRGLFPANYTHPL